MRRFIWMCCAVVVGIAVASPGWAATLEVKPGIDCGGDTGNFCTVSQAIPSSVSGDTIHIAAGIYNETLTVKHNLTFEGDGAATTIIDGTEKGASVVEVQQGITATFRNLTLTKGSGAGLGGGGVNNSGILTLEDMVISDNTAGGAGGGGILNLGTLTLVRSMVSGNHTTNAAGGVYTFNEAFTDIVDSTITNNSADSFAGGLYAVDTAMLRVRNSTISGNATNAQGGGALINIADGFAGLYNVTITGNTGNADADGFGGEGGLSVQGDPVIVANTIIAGNVNTDEEEGAIPSDCVGTIDSRGNNLIGVSADCTGYATSDVLDVSPLLASLADNGGTTQTHALLANSPALDAGNPDGCTFDDQDAEENPITIALTTDQRGEMRAADGTGDGTAVCDIGAMEVVCGDGRVHGNEVCDDSNTADGDACSADCAAVTDCGNGVIEGNEVCDDDNTSDDDGCSADCSEIEDLDGDGSLFGVDCNDGDSSVFSGAVEICDGKDNDCDDFSDELDACPVADTDTDSDDTTPDLPSDDTAAPAADDDDTAADTAGAESTDDTSSAAASGCSLLVPMGAR